MYKLVIVDDEVTIAEGIANLFPWDNVGFESVYFINPEQALGYIKNNHVDVLMSDIEMPGMNGLELAEKVKEYNIHVVFISSHQNYEYFRSAIQLNVVDYLLKPLKSNDIMTCFSKLKQDLDEKNHIEIEESKGYYDKILVNVKEYIENNFQEASLDEIAVKVNLSSSYLSRLLKEKCEFSFAEYLLKVRMEKAASMLFDLQYKSYDIAYYVGYDNPKSFSHAFKNYFGTTPMEYRKGSNEK